MEYGWWSSVPGEEKFEWRIIDRKLKEVINASGEMRNCGKHKWKILSNY